MPSPDSPARPPWGWIVLSVVIPIGGLLGVPGAPDGRRKAFATVALVVAVHVTLLALHALVSWGAGESLAGMLVRAVRIFVVLAGGAFGGVYTHDAWARTAVPTPVRPWFFAGDASAVADGPDV